MLVGCVWTLARGAWCTVGGDGGDGRKEPLMFVASRQKRWAARRLTLENKPKVHVEHREVTAAGQTE